jgi:hypothetical protein
MKKLQFAFDKTNLSAINASLDKGRELISAPFESARLFDYIRLLTNIKSGDYLPLINFEPSFVAGGCSYTNNNNVVLSERVMTTKLLKSDVTLCPNDLAGSGFERYLAPGANTDGFTFEDALKTYLIGKYALAIQNMALTGVAGNNSIDGLVTRIYAESGVLQVTGTAPSATDALTKLFAIYQKMPAVTTSADKRPVIIVGNDWLKNAVLQAFNDNRYFGNVAIDADNGFILPATNVRVQGFDVLNGTNKAIAGTGDLLFVGTDLQDDMAQLIYWWSEDNQEIRTRIQFRLGTQIAFPSLFVRYIVQQ